MNYALINKGQVVNVITADPEFVAIIAADYEHIEPLDTSEEQGLGVGIGWGWDGSFVAPEAVAEVPQAAKRHITQLAFMNRFTDGEAVAIDLASIGATVQAASMRRYQAKVSAAQHIDLDRADTRAGVQALEAMGILADGRAAVILDTPLSDQEIAKG